MATLTGKMLPVIRWRWVTNLTKINKLALVERRSLHVSMVHRLKQICQEEKNGEIVIKGELIKSPREDHLIPQRETTGECTDCSLCRLDHANIHVRHTDVLILNQFVDLKGKQLPRDVTGLCKYQHQRLNFLILMARHAGLIPRRTDDGAIDERDFEGWKALNKYYDEEAIDDMLEFKRKKV